MAPSKSTKKVSLASGTVSPMMGTVIVPEV